MRIVTSPSLVSRNVTTVSRRWTDSFSRSQAAGQHLPHRRQDAVVTIQCQDLFGIWMLLYFCSLNL